MFRFTAGRLHNTSHRVKIDMYSYRTICANHQLGEFLLDRGRRNGSIGVALAIDRTEQLYEHVGVTHLLQSDIVFDPTPDLEIYDEKNDANFCIGLVCARANFLL